MQPDPLVLSFDTSAAHCAAALISGSRVLGSCTEDMTRGQAERLVPMLEALLAEAARTWDDLDAIGVCCGPGNFTGIRIGLSCARGLGLALSIPVVGLSRLDALGWGTTGPVLVMVDARGGRCYMQRMVDGTAVQAPILTAVDAIVPDPGERLLGHHADAVAERTGAPSLGTNDRADSVVLARLAADRMHHDVPPPAPLYIRAPDAVPSRDIAPKRPTGAAP